MNYRVRPESIEKFDEIGDKTTEQLKSIDGMKQCLAAVDENGKAVVVGVWDTEQSAQSAQSEIAKVWASIGEHIIEQPTMTVYPDGRWLK